jgi:CRP/FNR family transcriptional regulator
MVSEAGRRDGAVIDTGLLRRVPLFQGFSEQQLGDVARLVKIRRFGKHELVVREGDPGEAFYVILGGTVAIVRTSTDGRETILSILKDRDFFGEMSVLDTSTRSASVRAMTNVVLGVIERDPFLDLIDHTPGIGRLLVVALSERLRAANQLITSTASQDIRSRLATLLLNLMQSFGEPTETGTRISLRLTNQELANMIGTTRETVNRTLNRFWDEHMIDMRTTHIVLTDLEKLRALT